MKTVHELNQAELEELRETYFEQLQEMDADVLGDIICHQQMPMGNVISHYEGMSFTEDDFWCNI